MSKIRLKSAGRKSGIPRAKIRSVMAELFKKSQIEKAAKRKAAPKRS
jgi:hypothetical protein